MQIGVYSMSEQEEKAKNWETWQRHKEISQHLATLEREIRDTGQLLVDVGFCMKEISASSGKIKLAEGQICITTPGNNRSRLVDPSSFSKERLVGLLQHYSQTLDEKNSLAETLRKVGMTNLD